MLFTATLPLFAAFAFGIAVRSAPAQAAPCAPSFRSIHDFKAGDVFQYRIWRRTGDPSTQPGRGTETIRKYRILSRRDSGDTLLYGISGIARTSWLVNGRAESTSTASFHETLRFIDSAGHRLNGCDGDIVPFPEFDYSQMIYARLRALPADTRRFTFARPGETHKTLGQEIGIRTSDTTLSPLMDVNFFLVYAEGLGLIERFEGGGMMLSSLYSEVLTGYIREGSTFGAVSPEEELPLAIRKAERSLFKPTRKAGAAGTGSAAFDLRGRRIPGAAAKNKRLPGREASTP